MWKKLTENNKRNEMSRVFPRACLTSLLQRTNLHSFLAEN